jgi:hypothetical protein
MVARPVPRQDVHVPKKWSAEGRRVRIRWT